MVFVYPGPITPANNCIYDNAYVDGQTGRELSRLRPSPTETVTEANFYFKLSAFQKPLLDGMPSILISSSPRRAATKFSARRSGLRDLSITRTSVRWVFPSGRRAGTFLTSGSTRWTAYLSLVGARRYEKDRFWPPISISSAKKIIRFHFRVLPAFPDGRRTSATETNLGHGWLLMDSAKNEQVARNVVRPGPIVHVRGIEELSISFAAETVFGQDGQFQLRRLVQRYNSDLRMVSEILLVARHDD